SRLSATDEGACVVFIGCRFDNTMLFERRGADSVGFCAAAAAHFQRRFRQTVCRIERFPTKAALAECSGKAPQRLKPHWLGAVISYSPTMQIKSCALLRVHPAQAQVVREVWTTGVRDLKTRDGFQPAHRVLEERRRRHDGGGEATIERLDNAVYQAH